MKIKEVLTLIILLSSIYVIGQKDEEKRRDVSVQYFGNLGFHPGVEIDLGISMINKKFFREKVNFIHQLNFRPSLTYYRLPKYTNNFLVAPSLNYHFRIIRTKTNHYFFFEPTFKTGYLRYYYIGDSYETSSAEFVEKKFTGGNSFVFGGGLNLGGSILPNKIDWLLGAEYLAEISEDELFINHINLKAGLRFKIKRK